MCLCGASPDTDVPCSGVDVPTFATKMYQWASTLTYQGRNMPFALPFRTDPLDTGFVVRRHSDHLYLTLCNLVMAVSSYGQFQKLL